jgi:hypothetical protein
MISSDSSQRTVTTSAPALRNASVVKKSYIAAHCDPFPHINVTGQSMAKLLPRKDKHRNIAPARTVKIQHNVWRCRESTQPFVLQGDPLGQSDELSRTLADIAV